MGDFSVGSLKKQKKKKALFCVICIWPYTKAYVRYIYIEDPLLSQSYIISRMIFYILYDE